MKSTSLAPIPAGDGSFAGQASCMDFASIRYCLKPSNGITWRAVLNDEAAVLMDRPIAIEIETRAFPDDSPVPAISDVEARLIDSILARLPDCIVQCERLLDTDPTIGHISLELKAND